MHPTHSDPRPNWVKEADRGGQGRSRQYQSRCPCPDRTSSPVERGKAGQLIGTLAAGDMDWQDGNDPRAVRSKATVDAAHRDICALAFSTPTVR